MDAAATAAGNSQILATCVPSTLASQVHELARENDRTVSAELRRALKRYVESERTVLRPAAG